MVRSWDGRKMLPESVLVTIKLFSFFLVLPKLEDSGQYIHKLYCPIIYNCLFNLQILFAVCLSLVYQ